MVLRKRINQALKLVLCFLISSCSLMKQNVRVAQLNYCAPQNPYVYDSTYIPLDNISSYLTKDNVLLKRFSYQDMLLANASGSFFLLRDLILMQESKTTDDDSLIYIMVKKQQVLNRLLLASTELASIAAELDCESERSKQLGNYLDQINDTRVQRLTIASVISGVATAIITSASNNHKTQVSVGINGSLISAALGAMAVFSSRKSVVLSHSRNLLADIWYKPKTSSTYPPFIWFVLSTKEFNIDGNLSTVESLKYRWVEEGLIDYSKKKENLFFGAGGKYLADDLHTRTSMINQLKAEIRSINQDLQSLMLKLTI
ncbi:MAG: hypothetical protein ABI388_04490 [Bacteroidia bacterium]